MFLLDVPCKQRVSESAVDAVRYKTPFNDYFVISLIRMRSKRDIKMGRLCTPGGAVLGIVGGGV